MMMMMMMEKKTKERTKEVEHRSVVETDPSLIQNWGNPTYTHLRGEAHYLCG